ncbi:hypothetical protein SMSP1_01223 [Sedimentisphaera salicampi]|nr:hypothetical protein SMSP1_01223 [Sedimentisphaera salicampi]
MGSFGVCKIGEICYKGAFYFKIIILRREYMERIEIKEAIADLEARILKVRDWL